MKKSETTKIVAKLMMVYPSFKFGTNILTGEETSLLDVVTAWHEQIGDMDYDRADKAVNICINECKYVPSIAEIREKYGDLLVDEHNNESQIKNYYQSACGSYPIDIPRGTGWDIWQERAKDGKQAFIFYECIMQYLNSLEGDAMDFEQCLRTICRDGDGKIFFKQAQ